MTAVVVVGDLVIVLGRCVVGPKCGITESKFGSSRVCSNMIVVTKFPVA